MTRSVVVYFQPMRRDVSVPSRPAMSEVQDVHGGVGRDEHALREVSSEPGALIEEALDRAHLTKESAARLMGVTGSLFGRQLQNLDNQHVSIQRLWNLPDAFWRELLIGIAERRKLARVRRRIILEGL